ncbi:MAG: hypothetical protein KatS3mg101_0051 [Patescibacteria group bacterium]|nr:MAG: hypothetical protein KatS3mg101_0051 [Patescibacteria group bacterium]
MVDNPFFPGYKPRYEGETTNPLFPGYKMGQKPYRRYDSAYLGKFEYSADYWLDQLDRMSADIADVPKWLLNRYWDDFRASLKARYNPADTPIEQIDDYDQDVLPGVSDISLTLDPFEWKDPKKVLEKTAKDWIKAGTGLRFKKQGWGLEAWPIDLTDYENRVKTGIWKAAMGVQQEISGLGEAGGRAVAAATRARGGEPGEGTLFNFADANGYIVAKKKVYETMAYNAVDAQRYMQAGQKRDSKHDAFVASMATAIDEEINGEYEIAPTATLDDKGAPVLDGQVVSEKKLYRNRRDLFKQLFDSKEEAKNFEDAAKIFKYKKELALDMGSASIEGAISGPVGLTAHIKARLTGNKNAEARGEVLYAGGNKTVFEYKIEELKNNIADRLSERGKNSIQAKVDAIREIDKASAEAVQKYADEYKEYLRKVQEVLNTYTGDDRALLNRLSNIKVNGKTLTGGGLFDPSIQRQLLRQINSDITLAGKISKIDKKYQIGTYLGKIEQLKNQANKEGKTLQELFEQDGQHYYGFFANQARLVASRLEEDRASYAIEEFYDAITQGRFMERYVWNRISKRLVGYTPGELVQTGLNKVGYFGLSIDDDQVSEKLRNSVLFNTIFRNKFTITLDNSGKIFDSEKETIKAVFRGSKDLAIIDTVGGTLANVGHLERDDILRLLTGTDPNNIDKFWDKVPGFWKTAHFSQTLRNQVANFQKWLAENGKAVGITLKDYSQMSEKEKQALFALFNALNKENKFYGTLKITKEFSGMIQRIGVNLNKLQDKIFGFALFQKTIKPLLQIKTIASERLSQFVAEIVTSLLKKLIHVGTQGATVIFDKLLETIIKPLVRFLTRKAVEFTQNFVFAIARGDISTVMKQIDKEIESVVKFSMYLIGIPTLVIFAIMMMLFGNLVSSVSPIDPAKDNAGYSGSIPGGFPQGENELIKIEKDVIVVTGGDFSGGQRNPNSIENDVIERGNVTVYYEIRIMPKVTIEGSDTIEFEDIVTRIYNDGDSVEETTIRRYTGRTPGGYVAGETYTIVLGIDVGTPVALNSTMRDSLIKNTLTVVTPSFDTYLEDEVNFVRYLRIGTPPVPSDCFVLTNFPGDEQANFEAALINIASKTGGFLNRLCSAWNNQIVLQRVSGGAGYCGRASHGGTITFNDVCTSYYTRLDATSYLLAHELGHLYNWRVLGTNEVPSGYPYSFVNVMALDGGSLPTYDGHCGPGNDEYEDFAETIGNFVEINRFGTCYRSNPEYANSVWGNYPNHLQFAQEVIAAP